MHTNNKKNAPKKYCQLKKYTRNIYILYYTFAN